MSAAGVTKQARPVTPAGLVAARLAQLVEWADQQSDIASGIKDELRAISSLAGGLDPYLDRATTPESPALAALARRTGEHDWTHGEHGDDLGLEQEMLSGHVEGQTLKMLVHATRARRVLEIGMFTGYAALAMAEAMTDDGRVVTCEIDPGVAEFARGCFAESPAGHRIDVRVGSARDTLAALAADGEPFDLVFVDADKAGYLDYLRTVLDAGLLAPHGLLCIDNTLMQGQPWTGSQTANGTAIAGFNDALAADPRVEQVIIPLRDGLTLVRRVDGFDEHRTGPGASR